MKSFLKYRFPGQSIIEIEGSFLPIQDLKKANGFLVSDFLKKNIYQFSEKHSMTFVEREKKAPFEIDKSEYLQRGKELLTAIQRGEVEKVVFSRVKCAALSEIDLNEAFESLSIKYPSAFVYCFQDPNLGIWLGASPEQLLYVEDGRAETVSLAGTREQSSELPWSEKEYREQNIVTEFISECLNSLGLISIYTSGVKEFFAGPLRHLKTEISFELNNQEIANVIDVLHPTPAVCGRPSNAAIRWIQKSEVHDRELYSGFIGLVSNKKANFYVNLRCCQWIGNKAYLYLGGGYTEDSIPELEWEETENKSKTVLSVLQKN